jgi:hypothetical protein
VKLPTGVGRITYIKPERYSLAMNGLDWIERELRQVAL